MIRKTMIFIITLLTLSIIGALVLTLFGKNITHSLSSRMGFFQYMGYYTIMRFIIQLLSGLVLVYYGGYYLLRRLHLYKWVLPVITGIAAFILVCLLRGNIETYHFEPQKHFYQITIFLLLGFCFPIVYSIARKLLGKHTPGLT